MALMPQKTSSLIDAAKQRLEASISPALKEPYLRIVVAGLKVMFASETHKYMQEYVAKAKSAKNLPVYLAHGILQVLSVIQRESQGKMDAKAAGPAGLMLLLYALEYLEQTKQIEVTQELIVQTGKAVSSGVLAWLKVDPAKMKRTPSAPPAQQPIQPVVPTGGA